MLRGVHAFFGVDERHAAAFGRTKPPERIQFRALIVEAVPFALAHKYCDVVQAEMPGCVDFRDGMTKIDSEVARHSPGEGLNLFKVVGTAHSLMQEGVKD